MALAADCALPESRLSRRSQNPRRALRDLHTGTVPGTGAGAGAEVPPEARVRPVDVIDVLDACAEFLDNYADAEYVDGRPVGNRAMSLKMRCEEARDAISREQDRQANEH